MQILLSISVLLWFGHGAQYEVTEEACANDRLFISSAEECESAANALGIRWNSCCQNNDNLPYGCLKRSDNDVIWNGNANTPNQFPCTVAGNCDHGMRWAVCYKGDDSIFSNENHKKCCLDGWERGQRCQGGCPNCNCLDGSSLCGCIWLDQVDPDDYLQTVDATPNAAHLVVQGRTSWGGWGSAPDSYCQRDDDNQAAYDSSKHSRNIGVGCCSTDGTKGYRPDCNAHPATYQEAVDLCAQNGYRLCTEHEMLFGKSNGKGITEGTGCWYDAAYQWVSDECDVETAAAAAASGSNKSGASDGEDSSFDDFIPTVLGAAAGIAVIAAIVALVVAMRKKKVTEETVTGMSDVVHVPDASAVSVDGDEAVATR